MDIGYIKSVHIIFVVTWFAALFYMPRLFVYDIEARQKSEPEKTILLNQFRLMQKRLWYGIAWPSCILTLILGTWIALEMELDSSVSWFITKVGLVIGLVAYHITCQLIMMQLRNNVVKFSSQGMRLWNEIATIFLVAIVFLVEMKNELSALYGLLGLIALIITLILAINIYKRLRK
jgi:putative membrane protein